MSDATFTVELVAIPSRAGRPPPPSIPPRVRAAMVEYGKLYRSIYGMLPPMTWDGEWCRVGGGEGMTFRRLKERITQMKHHNG